MKSYFSNQIKEIQEDKVLRIYGSCLAIGQVLTFLFWLLENKKRYFSQKAIPICWPFFENCFDYRVLGMWEVKMVLYFFGLMSFIGIFLFLSRRLTKTAYWWLIGINFLKTLMYIQDFRLRMNQHYMLYFITLVFLFLPNKRNLIRYTIVLFYVWAGTIKINMEWLSGAALDTNPLWITDQWIPLACLYTIILECIFSWGLLSANKKIYWAILFQMFLFHLVSFPIVGFYYPLLMYSLLAIFPLTFYYKNSGDPPSLIGSLIKGKQTASTYVFIGFFCFLQMIPIMMPGDEKITGEGRIFALHMFDALVHCEGELTLKFKDGISEKFKLPIEESGRIKCDPVVNFNIAKWKCLKQKNNPQFNDLDIYYQARKSTQWHMRPLVDVKDFCSQNLNYSIFRPNKWIKR